MALCYNFIRVLNILGFERFLAAVAKALSLRQQILKAAMDVLQAPAATGLQEVRPEHQVRAGPPRAGCLPAGR